MKAPLLREGLKFIPPTPHAVHRLWVLLSYLPSSNIANSSSLETTAGGLTYSHWRMRPMPVCCGHFPHVINVSQLLDELLSGLHLAVPVCVIWAAHQLCEIARSTSSCMRDFVVRLVDTKL